MSRCVLLHVPVVMALGLAGCDGEKTLSDGGLSDCNCSDRDGDGGGVADDGGSDGLDGDGPSGMVSARADRLGAADRSYTDPEILSELDEIAFLDENRQIWLGRLDPETGAFATGDGRDLLVAEEVTPPLVSFNGPEFGVDRDGWCLFFSKDFQGTPQAWRARLNGESVQAEPLVADAESRLSVLASKDPAAPSVRLLYSRGGASVTEGSIVWSDEDDVAGSEVVVADAPGQTQGPRWIDDGPLFTLVDQAGAPQAAIYDTRDDTLTHVTSGGGSKSYTYGWWAPEFGTLAVLVVLDDTRLVIQADTGQGWARIQSIELPQEATYPIIGSPEPFVAGGRSYISLVLKERVDYSPGEVWVLGLDGTRIRCDDGLGAEVRSDPEAYRGADQVFVIYNLIRPQGPGGGRRFEAYSCATGLAAP